MAPVRQLGGRRVQHNTMVAVHPALKLHNLSLPVCLWWLPSHCPSSRDQSKCPWESESVHKPFKRQLPISPGQNPHWFSQPRVTGFLSPDLVFHVMAPSVKLRCLAPWGIPAAEISLQMLNCHVWVWGQPISYPHPSSQSWCGFLMSSIIRSHSSSLPMDPQLDCSLI